MKALSEFTPYIMPFVLGCPQPTLERALVDAAITFCEDTLCIRQRCEAFTTEAGVRAYELEAPEQQQVARVLDGYCDTARQLRIIMSDQVGNPDPATTGTPTYIYTSRADAEFMLNMVPVPDKVYSIEIEAAMRPTRTATRLDDDLFHLWLDAMVAGSVMRIASYPGQPFTDPEAAARATAAFFFHARKARNEGLSGRVRATRAVQQRPFA